MEMSRALIMEKVGAERGLALSCCGEQMCLPKPLIYLRHVPPFDATAALFVAHLTQTPHNILIIHLDSASSLARTISTHFPR